MVSSSLWMDVDVAPNAGPLNQNEHCDVAVIGAGIAGLSTAYELAQRGVAVVVIDRARIAGGMTARTTAHLAPSCDDLMSAFADLRGVEAAKLFYESQMAAVDRIEEIQEKEGIDCGFRRLDGYLFQGDGMPGDVIDNEFDVLCKIGVKVDRLVGIPLRGAASRRALKFSQQATFHPLNYLAGLVRACEKRGVKFFSNTPVESIGETDTGVTLRTPRGIISAGKAVVTTNSPISDRFALHTKMAPYRTYAAAFRLDRRTIPDALFWDTEDPYHYVRLLTGEPAHDIVIVGGEDHKSGTENDAPERFARLDRWARSHIPALGDVVYQWSGQVLETIDHAAFIGRDPGSQQLYVSTGDSGQGITHGVLGALLNTDLIVEGQSQWADLYAPERTPVSAAWNYLSENVTTLKSFSDYIAPGEINSTDELNPGEGAIIRDGLQKIAAYRDRRGALHQRSAACTHVGCHLHWNSFETSWDCPCHGSIFSVDGEPLNAPAISSLEKLRS